MSTQANQYRTELNELLNLRIGEKRSFGNKTGEMPNENDLAIALGAFAGLRDISEQSQSSSKFNAQDTSKMG